MWGACESLLSFSLPLFPSHTSQTEVNAWLSLRSPLQRNEAGKREGVGGGGCARRSCPDWWERHPKTPSGEKKDSTTTTKFTISPLHIHLFLKGTCLFYCLHSAAKISFKLLLKKKSYPNSFFFKFRVLFSCPSTNIFLLCTLLLFYPNMPTHTHTRPHTPTDTLIYSIVAVWDSICSNLSENEGHTSAACTGRL